ncbi:type II toxin-antitoxin system HicB family antitoxin [Duganella sp.]|uniref:type II toxin-antitoxin system HicB family antitoxin n=1 Tax=Duganella sp. TaxID=1904440 RepID=UPI0031D7404F
MMLYPLYVWKEEGSAYGGSFPDLPGVFTAADELTDLPAMAQEAVLAMYSDGNEELPKAATIDRWRDAPQFQDGFWMMVEINLPADRPVWRGRG